VVGSNNGTVQLAIVASKNTGRRLKYPCNTGNVPLTINSGGIAVGIGVAGSDLGSGVTACSPGSCDVKVTPASGGFASGIWHWTTSGQTPNFTASNNDNAGMLAASWH
jgi:hypothetical protein